MASSMDTDSGILSNHRDCVEVLQVYLESQESIGEANRCRAEASMH